jgi:hypothetical protein
LCVWSPCVLYIAKAMVTSRPALSQISYGCG